MRKRTVCVASLVVVLAGLTACASVPRHTAERADWPSYNRSLTSERYAPLGQIDRSNVAELKVACTYDLGIDTSFQTGPIVIGRTLYGSTEKETFAIDAATCAEKWRVREEVANSFTKVNRGVAYLDGRLFRGLQDGRVVSYDAATGRKLWESGRIADMAKGETVPAANLPITGGATWTSYSLDPASGLLYVPGGNPAPDFAASFRRGENLFSNSVLVLDAKTGAYRRHFSLVPEDFHDWDVAAAPTLVTTRGGRRLLAAAPKDGQLYAHDLADGKRLYVTATTTRENTTAPLTPAGTRFCPGTHGGTEWNGPAYSPQTNLIYVGAVDWCTTVRIAEPSTLTTVAAGQPWTGGSAEEGFGKMDPQETTLDGAAGGGVITYVVDGRQWVAFVAGTNSPIWPVEKKSAKIVVFGRPVGR